MELLVVEREAAGAGRGTNQSDDDEDIVEAKLRSDASSGNGTGKDKDAAEHQREYGNANNLGATILRGHGTQRNEMKKVAGFLPAGNAGQRPARH